MLHTTKRSTGATDAADEERYVETVNQAKLGADLDFLRGSSGSTVTRGSH